MAIELLLQKSNSIALFYKSLYYNSMTYKASFTNFKSIVLPAILNSYSVVFFFNNRFFAAVLLLVSFFNLFAGLSGLLAVLIAVLIGNYMGVDKSQLKKQYFKCLPAAVLNMFDKQHFG